MNPYQKAVTAICKLYGHAPHDGADAILEILIAMFPSETWSKDASEAIQWYATGRNDNGAFAQVVLRLIEVEPHKELIALKTIKRIANLCGDYSPAIIIAREALAEMEHIHGVNCPKASHADKEGLLHSPLDDGPYDVDGQSYCGRCHIAL